MMKKELIGILIFTLLISTAVLPASGSLILHKNIHETLVTTSENLGNEMEQTFEIKDNSETRFVSGEMIIKFDEEVEILISVSIEGVLITDIPSIDNLNQNYEVFSAEKIFEKFSISALSNIYKFILPDDANIVKISEEYSCDPNVIYAEPNYIHQLFVTPDDPSFNQQWSLHNIGQTGGTYDADIDAPEAWDIEIGSSDVVIAIVDSGVDYTHPDLADNIWINEDEIPGNGVDDDNNGFVDDICGWDFANDDNDPMDSAGHGTHCSGIASAVTNNGAGIAGVCWNCKIMPVQMNFMMDMGVTAIIYAVDNGADVISMSWGGYDPSQLLHETLQYAYDQGVVLAAAAGNDDIDKLAYPASYDEVIAVAATDDEDHKADFSNYGDWVDIAAPGVDIYSTLPNDKYKYASGTSMACPHVAGLAGLILSKDHSLNPDEVKFIIYGSADRLPPSETHDIGAGRINAYNALLSGPGPAGAEITYPMHGGEIRGHVEIEGSACGDGFQYYTIEHCWGGYPEVTGWVELINSSYPVQDNVIGTIDTTNLGEGFYYLLLTVVSNNGIYKDMIWMIVNNYVNEVIVDDDNIVGPWYGTPEYPYRFIQDGVTSSGSNDFVFVYNGTYYEHVKIWKTATIVGEDKNNTVIDGNGSGSVVRILADEVSVSGFTIQKGGGRPDGICMHVESDNNILSGNIIQNGKYLGLVLNKASHNKIYNNVIRKNGGYGIYLGKSDSNNISENLVADHESNVGIYLVESNNVVIQKNTVTNDANGIRTGRCKNCLIYKNRVSFCGVGILLEAGSTNNKIVANNISNSTNNGIFADKFIGLAYNNYIFYNNLIGNSINAEDQGINFWYKPEGLFRGKGNYWDDYDGEDRNGDGIGDTPYYVPERSNVNFDRYPFMKPVDIDNVVVRYFERDLAKFKVEMPRNRAIQNTMLQGFLEQFPMLREVLLRLINI
jgi:parallel beta-helix repeat protein